MNLLFIVTKNHYGESSELTRGCHIVSSLQTSSLGAARKRPQRGTGGGDSWNPNSHHTWALTTVLRVSLWLDSLFLFSECAHTHTRTHTLH